MADRLDNLKSFKKGESGNPNGRPKGSKNRSTIAKKILDMSSIFQDKTFAELKEMYPEIEKHMTAEEIMSVVMAHRAISKGDVNAYNALMASAYGSPTQKMEVKTDIGAIEYKEVIK